jgi:hypothetical protein
MTPQDIETLYDQMAQTLDQVPEHMRDVFLAKLVLLLAHDLGDVELAVRRIAEAAQDT